MAITASMVKELREMTGAGMMDCKKALTATEGDMDKAVDFLREKGLAGAQKKAGRIAAEGIVATCISEDEKHAVVVEVNAETDFVAKNEKFQTYVAEVAAQAVNTQAEDIEGFMAEKWALDPSMTVKEKLSSMISIIGENMNIRRVAYLEGQVIAQYLHGAKIGVLVAGEGSEDELKKVAMHVAASKPEFVNPEDVPADVVEHERQIQIDIAVNSGKPKEIAEKMVEGRMKKFTGEVSLTGQPFVMDPSVSVGDFLKSVNTSVSNFIRLEVGEGIEKKEEDFAAEVAKITGGNA